MKFGFRFLNLASAAAIAASLSACGGGGGGDSGTPPAGAASSPSSKPATAQLTLVPQSAKTLRFSWASVTGATSYKLREDLGNGAGYATLADAITASSTNYDFAVPSLIGRVNANYVLQACNSLGCTDSAAVAVSGNGNLNKIIGYFKASNTEQGDQFGTSIAISADGNTLALGAPKEDSAANLLAGALINGDQSDNSKLDSGAVYVFTRDPALNRWTQQAYVKKATSTDSSSDLFGSSLALSSDGSKLVVGAPGEGSNSKKGVQNNKLAPGSGAVYEFWRDSTTNQWNEKNYLKAPNPDADDNFGASVAFSSDGNTLAVGAPYESSNAVGVGGDPSDNSAAKSGAVYVFAGTDGRWAVQAYVKAANTHANDVFGLSVALSSDGNSLAVGAPGESSNAFGVNGTPANYALTGSGAAYVFLRTGTTWAQQSYLKAGSPDKSDNFGFSVSLSGDGNSLAIGAPIESSSATGVNGNPNDNTTAGSGAAYVFARGADGKWVQETYLKASNPIAKGYFGSRVSLSSDGKTLAIGAPQDQSKATGIGGDQSDKSGSPVGAAYVFTRGSLWTQKAYVKAPNAAADSQFGSGLALSSDGNSLVVSALGESSNAKGIGNDQTDRSAAGSGAVYLY